MKWPGRTPLSRVFHEKRRLIVPLAILALANVAALLLIVYPLSRRVAATEQRAADVSMQLAAATNEFRGARATQDGRAKTDTQLAKFYQEVLPRDFVAARRMTYVRLVQLARDANLEYERRSFNTEDTQTERTAGRDPASTLTRLDITFPLSGEYRDIRRFIHTLETAPEFIVISDVTMQPGAVEGARGAAKAPLALDLRLATYYRTPGDER